ncbi:MAG: phenylalanine--tRNA ligase beta subunit-related protein [Gammaproteobacteria bacterium]
MHFYQSNKVTELGIKTVTWIEYGVDNTVTPQDLDSVRKEYYTRAINNKDNIDECIAGYYKLRKSVDRSVRRFPPSPLALQSQFNRKGEIVSISTTVDIYNLVSLSTGLSIGAHDLSAINGDVRLDMTQGNERFHPIGSENERELPAGEYAYLDEQNQVLCRMEYRQSANTCLTHKNMDCLFIVQGHQDTSHEVLHQTADQVSKLLQTWCNSRRGEIWQTP